MKYPSNIFFCFSSLSRPISINNTKFFYNFESVLNQLDDLIISDSVPSSELFDLCLNILTKASIVLPDELETVINNDLYNTFTLKLMLHRIKSEEIVQKLKQLSSRIENNEQGFLRDVFRVISDERNAEYLVQAREYYSEVKFYKNSNRMMKLCQWEVYKLLSPTSVELTDEDKAKMKFIAQYNLEKSQSEDGIPTYVFGRTDVDDYGHVSIVNYGTNPGPELDGYYQMKLLVIKDLKSLKGLPVIARTIRDFNAGIHTVIIYGLHRRLRDSLGLETDNNEWYDDDEVITYDMRTGEQIENTEL